MTTVETGAVMTALGLDPVQMNRLAQHIKPNPDGRRQWAPSEVRWATAACRLADATGCGPAMAALCTMPILDHPEALWLVLDSGKPVLVTSDEDALYEAYKAARGVVTVVVLP